MKLVWTFPKRNKGEPREWPYAFCRNTGKVVLTIGCEDPYEPNKARNGDHQGLYLYAEVETENDFVVSMFVEKFSHLRELKAWVKQVSKDMPAGKWVI